MSGVIVEIPQEAIHALKIPETRATEELCREFAVFLVREGLLPRPQARLVARMGRLEFEDLLARRKVSWEVDAGDVIREVDVAEELLEGEK